MLRENICLHVRMQEHDVFSFPIPFFSFCFFPLLNLSIYAYVRIIVIFHVLSSCVLCRTRTIEKIKEICEFRSSFFVCVCASICVQIERYLKRNKDSSRYFIACCCSCWLSLLFLALSFVVVVDDVVIVVFLALCLSLSHFAYMY